MLAKANGTKRKNIPGVLCLVKRVQSVLQQVERHCECWQILVETQLFESKEILAEFVCKIATNELLAAVVECTCAIWPSTVVKSRTLRAVSKL